MVLALLASLLVIVFQADEIAMLPLYALGVMLDFSLSQMGMFRLMGKILRLKPGETAEISITQIHYEKNAKWKRLTSLAGAIITSVVFLILLTTKFLEGEWLVALMIPVLVVMFYSIHRHYEGVATALSTQELDPESFSGVANFVIVPIADVHRGSLLALQYAKRLSSDVRALTVVTSPELKERLRNAGNASHR